MNFFINLKRYLYAYVIWLSKVKDLWGIVLPLALLLFITLFDYDLGSLVRYVGLALEVLGLMTVAVGLKGKRQLFKKPSLLNYISDWLNQRPHWTPVTHVITASLGSASSINASAKLSVWSGSENDTLESKLKAIEKNLLSLREEFQISEQEAKTKYIKLVEDIVSERRTRELSISEINARMENLGAKDISFEALGIYWLFWGLIFSSLSSELAKVLALLG